MAKQPKQEPSDKKVVDNAQSYLKYSGMAFQMAAILIIGALAGRELDERYQTERPYFTLILVIFAIIGAFYLTLKDFIFTPPKQGKNKVDKNE